MLKKKEQYKQLYKFENLDEQIPRVKIIQNDRRNKEHCLIKKKKKKWNRQVRQIYLPQLMDTSVEDRNNL